MVKSVIQKKQQNENSINVSSCKYKGVRIRKWGKYVSEVRLPNSRERIWLGSFTSAEKAARAFDAALFCLRGKSAKLNFPDNPPDIVNGMSLTPAEIQIAAAEFANSETWMTNPSLDHSFSFSTSESLSISDGVVPSDGEMSEIPLDFAFLDNITSMGSGCNNLADNEFFPEFDDFSGGVYFPPLPSLDYGDENCDYFASGAGGSFLWNF